MRAVYGCMGLTGIGEATAAVEAALDAGFKWFDHADIYGRGGAEAVFGEVLAQSPGLRQRVQLQTKCGIRLATDDSAGMYDLRGDAIRRHVHESLDRLRTDYVDVLLLHRPDPLAETAEAAAALTDLVEQGLVREVGVSNMSGHQIAALQSALAVPLRVNQLEMSLHRRDWLEAGVLVNTPAAAENGFPLGTLEHCAAAGIRLQAWGAMAQGRFTGRPQSEPERTTAELVTRLAEAKGTTPETIVLWWLQRHPARIAPVVGTTNPDRIRACHDAVTKDPDLTHEEWYELWVTARGTALP